MIPLSTVVFTFGGAYAYIDPMGMGFLEVARTTTRRFTGTGVFMFEYWKLPGFECIYLEDSWVTDVVVSPGAVEIAMDLVLRECHPLYRPPLPTEQYCYHRGSVRFDEVEEATWTNRSKPPTIDASGELDYGSIDSFSSSEGRHLIEGGFGRISVKSVPPRVLIAV